MLRQLPRGNLFASSNQVRSLLALVLVLPGTLVALPAQLKAQEPMSERGANLATGLLAHYSLDGDALDASGWNRHGTLSGSPSVSFGPGAVGLAADLRGVDSWIDLPVVLNSLATCSIAVFFQADSYNPNNSTFAFNALFSEVLPASPTTHVALALDENPILRVFLLPITGFAGFLDPPTPWTHVVFAFDAQNNAVTVYQNGKFEGSTQVTGPPPTVCGAASTATLGAINYNGTLESFFDGRIDEVRIYDRLLGEPEAAALWAEYANIFLDGFETGSTNAWSP